MNTKILWNDRGICSPDGLLPLIISSTNIVFHSADISQISQILRNRRQTAVSSFWSMGHGIEASSQEPSMTSSDGIATVSGRRVVLQLRVAWSHFPTALERYGIESYTRRPSIRLRLRETANYTTDEQGIIPIKPPLSDEPTPSSRPKRPCDAQVLKDLHGVGQVDVPV